MRLSHLPRPYVPFGPVASVSAPMRHARTATAYGGGADDRAQPSSRYGELQRGRCDDILAPYRLRELLPWLKNVHTHRWLHPAAIPRSHEPQLEHFAGSTRPPDIKDCAFVAAS